MDGHRFDELAKALAGGVSRRGVLRALVGAAAGSAAVAGRGRTAAQGSDCAGFCQHLPPGDQRGRCVADCAQGGGLFAACAADPTRLCQEAGGAFVCCLEPTTVCGAGGCVCPACPAPYVPNQTTCACACPPVECTGDQTVDPATCTCACSAGTEVCESTGECVSTTCSGVPTGQVYDPTTCQCACPPGLINCKGTNACQKPCGVDANGETLLCCRPTDVCEVIAVGIARCNRICAVEDDIFTGCSGAGYNCGRDPVNQGPCVCTTTIELTPVCAGQSSCNASAPVCASTAECVEALGAGYACARAAEDESGVSIYRCGRVCPLPSGT